jgi:hypothetical protein
MIRAICAAFAFVILSTTMSSAQNPNPPKADPAIYAKMRASALTMHDPDLAGDAVAVVLMDWYVGNGTASVLAASDGTASLYLSSGGGFIGGGQRYPQLREAAQQAVHLATKLISQFAATEATDLPPNGEVYFYVSTSSGVRRAIAKETDLRNGTDPLLVLGNTMQQIVTLYRLTTSRPPASR